MSTERLPILTVVSLVFAVAACDSSSGTSGEDTSGGTRASSSKSSGPAEPSPAARAEATKIFQTRCTPCHGAQGAGDGPTSKGLTPVPRNLRDAAWQSKVDDAYLEKVIQMGGMAVGKSPAMPPNPDLADKPEVLKALRAHVRSLRTN
jgi:mono/diheme cytochrome c family protein